MKTTTIELDHGTMKVQTKAYVFGEWAAHRGKVGWRVTHVPSGIGTWGLCDGMDESDAVAVSRELGKRVAGLKVRKRRHGPGHYSVAIPDEEAHIIRSTFGEVLGQ